MGIDGIFVKLLSLPEELYVVAPHPPADVLSIEYEPLQVEPDT